MDQPRVSDFETRRKISQKIKQFKIQKERKRKLKGSE